MTQQLLRTNNLSKQVFFLMALFSTKSILSTIEKPNSINFRRKVETRLIHLEGINSQMIKISSLSSLLRVLWPKFVLSSLPVLLYLSFSQGTQMSSVPKNNELSWPLELSSLYWRNELKARSNSYWANLALLAHIKHSAWLLTNWSQVIGQQRLTRCNTAGIFCMIGSWGRQAKPGSLSLSH